MFQRILIKISGEALKGKEPGFYKDDVIDDIFRQVKILQESKKEIALVFGGGNIWRGRENDDIPKGAGHEMGMLASTMNGIYMAERLKLHGMKGKVFTPFICGGMTNLYKRQEVLDCLGEKIIPIFSGGTGLPFFSTDTICAVRSADISVDLMVFTKEYRARDSAGRLYSGLYTADPIEDSSAKKINRTNYQAILKNQLEAIDSAASAILSQEKIPGTIINIEVENALLIGTNPMAADFYTQGTFIEYE